MRHVFGGLRALLAASLCLLAQMASAQVDIGFGGAPDQSNAPVEITSDSLSIDQSNGQAVFLGNVLVMQGELRMAAEAVSVSYGEVDGVTDIEEVSARGGVLITQGEDAAEGETAIYNTQTGVLTIEGDVLVTQGLTAISGDRMVVDLSNGSGTVEGRVRTVLRSQ